MGFTHVVIVAIVCAALGAVSWFVAPRGKNQVLYRSSALLTLACLFIMWACTYLAQLHPLIAPRRGDLRAVEH